MNIPVPCVFTQGHRGHLRGKNSLTNTTVFPASVRFNPRDGKTYQCVYTDAERTRVMPAHPVSLDGDEWIRDSLEVDVLFLQENGKIIGRSRSGKICFPKTAVPIGEWVRCKVEEYDKVLKALKVVSETSRERVSMPRPKGDGGTPRGKKRKNKKGGCQQQPQSFGLGTMGDLLMEAGAQKQVASTDDDSEVIKRFRKRHPNWSPDSK